MTEKRRRLGRTERWATSANIRTLANDYGDSWSWLYWARRHTAEPEAQSTSTQRRGWEHWDCKRDRPRLRRKPGRA